MLSENTDAKSRSHDNSFSDESASEEQSSSRLETFEVADATNLDFPEEWRKPQLRPKRRFTEPSLFRGFNVDGALFKRKPSKVQSDASSDVSSICRFDEEQAPSPGGTLRGETSQALDSNANCWLPQKGSKDPLPTLVQIETGDTASNSSEARSTWTSQLVCKAKQGWNMSKSRMMEKNGVCNVHFSNVEKRGMKFFFDLFTTFLEIKWRYTLLVFFFSFSFTWILFALIWWVLYLGRLKYDMECIVGVYDFTTALLFSIETQHTIGYGTRSITETCREGVFILMLQSTVGVLSQCIVTGIIFAKLALPKRRAATVIFSKNAVICQEDGERVLMFRVGNMRRTHMMGASINAMLIHTRKSSSGDIISYSQKNLSITTISDDSFFFLAWPIKVIHRIDLSSPLWNMTADDLRKADFEIIIVLEAACEASGASIQARTSYLPEEILWGAKLAPLFTKHKKAGRHRESFNIDFAQFNLTEPADTSNKSAACLVLEKNRFDNQFNLEVIDE